MITLNCPLINEEQKRPTYLEPISLREHKERSLRLVTFEIFNHDGT